MSINPARWRALNLVCAAVAAVAVTVVAAGPAWAHVETVPGEAVQSEVAVVTFRVPNERPDAGTVTVRLELPAEHPLPVVRPRTMPGWTAEVVKGRLDPPVRSGTTEITEAFRSITWTAAPGTRIGPGEFADFAVSLGPMPTGTDQLVINTVQTYDSGEVVTWDQPPGEGGTEPEHPAPVISLIPKDGGAPAATPAEPSDDTALWLGGAGLAVGALALGIALGTALRTRRTRTTTPTSPEGTA